MSSLIRAKVPACPTYGEIANTPIDQSEKHFPLLYAPVYFPVSIPFSPVDERMRCQYRGLQRVLRYREDGTEDKGQVRVGVI